jgi:glutathione-regulated potassium-efflux system ancillary protein KefF
MDTLASRAPPPRGLVIFAEPSLERVRLGRRLHELASALEGVQVRDLYELYPDFFIDAATERELLHQAALLVLVFQLRSYCLPALLVEWIDAVLSGSQLPTTRCWVIVGCPGAAADYRAGMAHGRSPADYLFCIEQTAAACGMGWIAPHVFYNADQAGTGDIDAHALKLERMIAETLGAVHGK